LQQLGELAKQNSLLPGRGVLEATNLRERCRAVIWEIRTVIKKGDDPLHPEEITKAEIDVSYVTAWKWALWTKKHLDGPRLELDRLKDSLTLTFVTHMAIVGSQQDRERYRQQIPGIRRNVDWAEERYRGNEDWELPPTDVLDVGSREWQQFLDWKAGKQDSEGDSVDAAASPDRGVSQTVTPVLPALPVQQGNSESKYEYWSLDPMTGRTRLPIADPSEQSRDQILRVWTKLRPWYKEQIHDLLSEFVVGILREPTVAALKLIHQPLLRRLERPPALRVLVRADMIQITAVQESQRIEVPTQTKIRKPEAITYSETIPIDMTVEDEEEETKLSDEDIIEKQLALYQQQ
jgi:hypothetical protein